MGVAILSSLAVREELAAGKLLAFDFLPEGAYRKIYLAWRKDVALTPLEQRFARYVRTETPKLI